MITAPTIVTTSQGESTVKRVSSKLLLISLLTLVAGVAMIAATQTYMDKETIYKLNGTTDTVQAQNMSRITAIYAALFGCGGVAAILGVTICALTRNQEKAKGVRATAAATLILAASMVAYAAFLVSLRNTGVHGDGYILKDSGTFVQVDYLIPNDAAMKALTAIGSLVAIGGAAGVIACGCTFFTAHKLAQKSKTQPVVQNNGEL
jgi:hypothetical protein